MAFTMPLLPSAKRENNPPPGNLPGCPFICAPSANGSAVPSRLRLRRDRPQKARTRPASTHNSAATAVITVVPLINAGPWPYRLSG